MPSIGTEIFVKPSACQAGARPYRSLPTTSAVRPRVVGVPVADRAAGLGQVDRDPGAAQPADGLGDLGELEGRDGHAHALAAAQHLGVGQPGPPVGQHQAVRGARVQGADQRAQVAGDLHPVRDQDQRVRARAAPCPAPSPAAGRRTAGRPGWAVRPAVPGSWRKSGKPGGPGRPARARGCGPRRSRPPPGTTGTCPAGRPRPAAGCAPTGPRRRTSAGAGRSCCAGCPVSARPRDAAGQSAGDPCPVFSPARRDGRGPVAPAGFVTWSHGHPLCRPADH